MQRLWMIPLIMAAVTAAAETVTLRDGRVLREAEIQEIDARGITIFYEDRAKAVTVTPEQFSAADQERFRFQIDYYNGKKQISEQNRRKSEQAALLLRTGTVFYGEILHRTPQGAFARMENPFLAVNRKYAAELRAGRCPPRFVAELMALLSPAEKRTLQAQTSRRVEELKSLKLQAVLATRENRRTEYQDKLETSLPEHRATAVYHSTSSPAEDNTGIQDQAQAEILLPLTAAKGAEWTRQAGGREQLVLLTELPPEVKDGMRWSGKIYRLGSYEYVPDQGKAMTVTEFTASAKRCLAYYWATGGD